MCSGRIHLRIAHEPEAGKTDRDRDETDEAKLPVGQQRRAGGSSRATIRGARNGSRPSSTSTNANAAQQRVGHFLPPVRALRRATSAPSRPGRPGSESSGRTRNSGRAPSRRSCCGTSPCTPRGCGRTRRTRDWRRTPARRSRTPWRRRRPWSSAPALYASARMTTRWRSASARIFSDSACAERAQLVGDAAALGLHPRVDRPRHVGRQLDAAQPHVDDLDADRLGVGVGLLPRCRHDLVALAGDRLVHGALVEFLGEVGAHRLRQPSARRLLVALHADVVLLDVDDPPQHEEVDEQRLLLGGRDAVGLGVVEQQDRACRRTSRSAAAAPWRTGPRSAASRRSRPAGT